MRLLISGRLGVMGKFVEEIVQLNPSFTAIYGFDIHEAKDTYTRLEDVPLCDAIIDFSHPSAVGKLLDFAIKHHLPIVLATTGYSNDDFELIKKGSLETPIFYSTNYSVGIYVVNQILKQVAATLEDNFDIEILDVHHNRKKDSPSGTALTIAKTINDSLLQKKEIVLGHTGKRLQNQLAIHSIRGGNVVGDHTVSFFGEEEVIEISHKAQSRKVFAQGAVQALHFLLKQTNGLYSMEDLMRKEQNHE